MNREYGNAERYADEAVKLARGSSSIYYYSMNCKAQLAEEIGRLNEGLRIYAETEKRLLTDKTAFMQKYDFRIGIIGIYLKRMELPSAKEFLDRARAMISGSPIPESLVSYSYDYNLAEYDMLSGNEGRGEEMIRRIIGDNETQNWADRLLIELAAAGRMGASQRKKILREYEAFLSHSAKPSPAFELLCARLYFQNGETEKAEKITGNVIAFSRKNQNRLRLVEADLLLIRMTVGSSLTDQRRRNNLLREAVYYSWENRILQPFYVDRDVLKPLWKDFGTAMTDKLSEEERLFVRDAMCICSQNGQTGEKDILSSRELEVLVALATGKTNPQIAESLCISLSTVKTHVLSIYRKLDVSSRINAIQEAKRLGLIQQTFDWQSK